MLDDPPATAAVRELLIALPPGVSVHSVLEVVAGLDPAYTMGIEPSLTVRSVRTAVDPSTLDAHPVITRNVSRPRHHGGRRGAGGPAAAGMELVPSLRGDPVIRTEAQRLG